MVDGKLHLNSVLSEVEQNGILKTTAAKLKYFKKCAEKEASSFVLNLSYDCFYVINDKKSSVYM